MDANHVFNYQDQFRFCKKQGHQELYSHICTYKLCDITRKCCSFCLQQNIHNHSMHNNNHIMDWKSFSFKTYKDHTNFQKQFPNNQEAVSNEQFLWMLLKNLQKLRKSIEGLEQNIETQLNMLTTRDICPRSDNPNAQQKKLDDETLNRWIRNQVDFEVEEFQGPLNEIQLQIYSELKNLNDYLEKKQHQTQKSRKYEIQQIKTDNCHSAILSSNEKYIVYNNNKTIRIYDIKQNKISKSNFQMRLTGYGFGSFALACDSQYLFAGYFGGNVKGFFFFVQKDFKQFYKQNIHQDLIIQIKIIQNCIITCSRDSSIIKTDFIRKCQIFQLKEAWHDINDFSIDYDQQKDILMCASNNFFKIWNCQDQSILIDKVPEKCQFFSQVQFVNNKQNILCLDYRGSLTKYKVDYQNKQLLQLDEYYYPSTIFGFKQLNDQNLLLLFEQYCRILNNQGELISSVYHNFQLQKYDLLKMSLHSLNNIAFYKKGGGFIKQLFLVKALN